MQLYKTSTFLNVDLNIYSKSDLDPLITALGHRVFVLSKARNRRIYEVHLELSGRSNNADICIRRFAKLIGTLPKVERKLWNTARNRDFNIGVQAAMEPHSYEIPLARETVEAADALKARIVFTIYAPKIRKKAYTKRMR